MQQMREQQAKLNKLKAEIKLKMDEEKTRLQQLQAENEVKARVKAYNAYDGLENCEQVTDHKVQYFCQNNEPQTSLNPHTVPFQPPNIPIEVSRPQEEVSLTPGLASLLISNHLPFPEPTVFSGCVEAIPHVKGLAILNDCEENHKLLKKLPEWIVRRWSRIVVDELDKSQEYPTFAHFTEFLQKDAKIACNPISSPFPLSTKTTDERIPKRAKALNTRTQMKPSISSTL
ncbi:Hypothetical predicted protein [Pelobates cultripes]|uniref:Uncharacterized protein n=1 Tax=Pelobates cultripes TaxID=61616 RepID=A0AAD1SPN0_PELCU|nr:Hypothetical predicted protein [Pelobates cultripes]